MGCIGAMTCTITSSVYHQYNCMNKHIEHILLHFDYVGVGATIYTLTLLLTYSFFHSQEIHRDNIVACMLILYFCNSCVQLLPCYASEQFLLHKNVLFLSCAFGTVICASLWAIFYADNEEFSLFSFRVLTAYLHITVGFVLFVTHYPERLFPDSKFVHIFLQSHMFWHV